MFVLDIMTSAPIDGIKRSNVCGDGYRIEGALVKSYAYAEHRTYLPYEDCSMTFKVVCHAHVKTRDMPCNCFLSFVKARRATSQMRIRILTLDINDIHAGIDCLDYLRFYRSPYIRRNDRIVYIERIYSTRYARTIVCSCTGYYRMWQSRRDRPFQSYIIDRHCDCSFQVRHHSLTKDSMNYSRMFSSSTDGGNVSGLGFKVVLTAFRTRMYSYILFIYDKTRFLFSQ
jgi:hypothetical protein